MTLRFSHKLIVGLGLSLALWSLALWTRSAYASASDVRKLAEIRSRLHDYGAERAQGLATLRAIDDYLGAAESEIHRKEARYLRVAALSELYFVAVLEGDAALLQQLASYLYVTPDQVDNAIHQAVDLEERGAFRQPCRRVRGILHLIPQGQLASREVAFAEVARGGAANGLLALHHVAKALDEGLTLTELAEGMGQDACAGPAAAAPGGDEADGQRRCTDALQALTPLSRRRFDGLARQGAWFGRVRRLAERGDPLARALLPEAKRLLATIAKRSVPLVMRVGPDALPEAPAGQGEPVVPRDTLVLSAERLTIGDAPFASVDGRGEVQVFRTVDGARLNNLQHAWASAGAKDGLTAALAPYCDASAKAGGPLALSNGGGAKAAMFSRLLRGLQAAGCGDVMLLARDAHGVPVGLRLELTLSPAPADPPVEVHIRPASVVVTAYGQVHECSRIRGEDGQWQVAWERIDRYLNARRRELAVFTYVDWADFDDVAEVMVRNAFDSRVRVQLP